MQHTQTHTHTKPIHIWQGSGEGVQCGWKEFSELGVQRGANSPKQILLSVCLALADVTAAGAAGRVGADVGVSAQALQRVRGLALGGSDRICLHRLLLQQTLSLRKLF